MILAKSILMFKLFVILILLRLQIVDEIQIPCADPEISEVIKWVNELNNELNNDNNFHIDYKFVNFLKLFTLINAPMNKTEGFLLGSGGDSSLSVISSVGDNFNWSVTASAPKTNQYMF